MMRRPAMMIESRRREHGNFIRKEMILLRIKGWIRTAPPSPRHGFQPGPTQDRFPDHGDRFPQ
jgi:hypothetical protein